MTRPSAGGLDAKTVALVRAAAALAEGKIAELKQRFVAAPAGGVPDLWVEDLVLVDAYGKVIGRPGLDMKRRELCTVAAIAVLGTAQQLHSHLRGALNTGATREEIEAVLALVEPDLDPEHKRRADAQWQDVKGRKL